MSTIRKIIERVDENKPNSFSAETKVIWLAQLDGKITADVFLMDVVEVRQFRYDPETDLDTELLVRFPHDDIYYYWLCAKIDAENGEYDKYQNTMQLYNASYNNFVNWFLGCYEPADGCGQGFRRRVPSYYITAYGLAVKRGFEGTIDQWLASLHGKSAYAIAKEMGFAGTEAEWLASLVGPKGEQGPQGEPGPAGESGAQIFIAVYEETTNAQIYGAYQAGKLVFAQDGSDAFLFPACMITETNAHFICYTGSRAFKMVCTKDVWSTSDMALEDTGNKTTVIDENSTDDQYPTAKAVEERIAKIAAEGDAVVGISITEHTDGSVSVVNTLESGATETIVIGADENGDPNSLTYNGVAIPFSFTVETAQAAEETT